MTLNTFVYRAGWPDRVTFRRFGRGWVRLGPYVLGWVSAWDRSDAS